MAKETKTEETASQYDMNNQSEILKPKLYQLTLFYNSVKDNMNTVQDFSKVVSDISNGKFRVLSYGLQVCAIGFVATIDPARLKKSFDEIGSNGESFFYLLVEVSGIIGGNIDSSAWGLLDSSPAEYKFWKN